MKRLISVSRVFYKYIDRTFRLSCDFVSLEQTMHTEVSGLSVFVEVIEELLDISGGLCDTGSPVNRKLEDLR